MDGWIKWVIIAILLFVQTGTHTVNRRANSTGSPGFSFWATGVSSALYITAHMLVLKEVWSMWGTIPILDLRWAVLVLFYATCNASGSWFFHKLSMRFLENGHLMHVGEYDERHHKER